MPVGTRRGRDVSRRGRRRAPHAQLRVGAPTAGGPSPTPPACSTATAASPGRSKTSGTTPTSTRCARSAEPSSNGRSTGASTSRTSTRTWGRCSFVPSSSTCTWRWRSTSVSRCGWPGASGERLIGFPYRRLAEEEGVVFPDHFVYTSVGSRRAIEKALFDLGPGVTEVYLHPSIDTDELRASHPDWANRVEDHAYLTDDPSFRDLIDRAGVRLIGYRALRELQRAAIVTRAVSTSPEALAALCEAAMPEERLTADELGYLCFGEHDEIIGDERGAATLQTQQFGEHVAAWLTLVVVHPAEQSRGRGKELVQRGRGPRPRPRRARRASRERGSALPLARRRRMQHARRNAARDVRVRAGLGRDEHGHRHRVSAVAPSRSRGRARDRRRRARIRRATRTRTGFPSSTARSCSVPRSRRVTRTGRRSASVVTRSIASAGSGRWRPSRHCSTAASDPPSSPRCVPTSKPAAAPRARSRGSAISASTASAARACSRVFLGGKLGL